MLERRYVEAGGNIQDLSEIKSKILYPDGSQCNEDNNKNYPIVRGAFQEDNSDPIYYYMIPTLTHFWNADDGDLARSYLGLVGAYDNAYLKTRNYLFSYRRNYTWEVNINLLRLYYYFLNGSIIDFYTTGNCCRYEIRNLILFPITLPTEAIVYPIDERKRISYEILGRAVHLLADMSVPAHTHCDEHGTAHDFYEKDYMAVEGDTLFTESENLVNEDGFMPFLVNNYNDATIVKNLFYIMNQVTQHFPSRDYNGDDIVSFGATYITNQKLNAWGDPLMHPDTRELDVEIARKTFNFCVGTTATLFYWFGTRTGMLKTKINDLYFDCNVLNPTFMIHTDNSITLLPGFNFSGTEMILTTEAVNNQAPPFNIPSIPIDIPNLSISLDSLPVNIPVDTLFVSPI